MARGQDYVKAKALEAVEAADGNRHEAALLLRVWADADEKLYRALTAPLMANLTALAVQRATGASDGHAIGGTGRKKGGKGRKSQIAEADLLAAIGSRRGQTMSSTRQSAAPPAQGSARHKQAVTLLASAYRRKPTG